MKNNYWEKYDELAELTKDIQKYYDVDKIKPYSVYIWSKGENGRNVFDIEENEIVFYGEHHLVPDEVKPIIKKIQSKIKEVRLSK